MPEPRSLSNHSPGKRNPKAVLVLTVLILVLASAMIGMTTGTSAKAPKLVTLALHVGPGEDMYEDLDSAVEDSEDESFDLLEIYVEPGIYETSLLLYESASIIGADPLSTILTPESGLPVLRLRDAEYRITGVGFRTEAGDPNTTAVDISRTASVEITNSAFEGFGTGVKASRSMRLDLVNVSLAFGGAGLEADKCENLTLIDCRFSFMETAAVITECKAVWMNRLRLTDVSGDGLVLEDSTETVLLQSFITCGGTGFTLRACDLTEIGYNFFTRCDTGLNLTGGSTNTTIALNEFSWSSSYGLFTDECYNNLITANNFLNNSVHAFDSGNNSWNFSKVWDGGNYWGGFEGVDNGAGDGWKNDGVADQPYNITGGENQDVFPLMEPVLVKMVQEKESGPGLLDFIFSLPSLGAAVLSIVLGVYVFRKNTKAPSNRVFFLIMLGCFIWGGGEFMHRLGIGPTWVYVWFILSNIGLLLITPSLFHFTFVYPTNVLDDKKWKIPFFGVYAPAVLLTISLGLFFNMLFMFLILGIILYFFLFVIMALVRIMIIYLKAKDDLVKMQAIYLTLGLIIILLIISAELVLGALGMAIFFVLIADSLIIFFIALFFAIAVLRYRLVDVEIIFKKTMFYSSMSVILGGIFLVFTESMEAFFAAIVTYVPSLTGVPDQAISLIAAFMVVLAIAPARIVIKRLLDRVFPQSRKFEKEYLDRLDAYEQTLRGMWADGNISEKEKEALITLRKRLDLTQRDHDEIEVKLKEEMRR